MQSWHNFVQWYKALLNWLVHGTSEQYYIQEVTMYAMTYTRGTADSGQAQAWDGYSWSCLTKYDWQCGFNINICPAYNMYYCSFLLFVLTKLIAFLVHCDVSIRGKYLAYTRANWEVLSDSNYWTTQQLGKLCESHYSTMIRMHVHNQVHMHIISLGSSIILLIWY